MVVISQLSQKIKNNPLLTKKQEFDLAKKAQQGSKEARQKLIESNFRLVISIAKVYNNVNVNKNDLIQEGMIPGKRLSEAVQVVEKLQREYSKVINQ